MSRADQQRWNERYAAGAYADRSHPSAFLAERLPWLHADNSTGAAQPTALDVACGAGRNTLFLATQGYAVTAVDGASVAIDRARNTAEQLNVQAQWLVADLEYDLPDLLGSGPRFDLILLIRYVNLALLSHLQNRLKPGGYLLVEQHLQTHRNVGGPGRAAFRVPWGALQAATPALQCIVAEQGIVLDPDGKAMALSRLLARKPALDDSAAGTLSQ